jgi:hypothetical protein
LSTVGIGNCRGLKSPTGEVADGLARRHQGPDLSRDAQDLRSRQGWPPSRRCGCPATRGRGPHEGAQVVCGADGVRHDRQYDTAGAALSPGPLPQRLQQVGQDRPGPRRAPRCEVGWLVMRTANAIFGCGAARPRRS